MKKKNAVYVVGEFPSDTEYFVQNEILGLQDRGIDIYVCALKTAGKRNQTVPRFNRVFYTTLFTGENIASYVWYIFNNRFSQRFFLNAIGNLSFVGLTDRLKSMRFFHFALLFAYRLRNIRVDHIHAHFISVPADVAMIMARMMNVQYTISAHAHDIIFGKHIPQKIAGCSALLVCHTSGKQRIVNNYCSNPVEAEKIHLVYHGVNNNFWKRQARAGETKQSFLKLLSVGRLVEKKGHKYLLEAVRRMAHKKIPLRCTIIGDGPLKSSFERFITAHQLKAHVFLAGGMCQNEVKNLLEDTDIFVLPCVTSENGDEDGIPNAILEAMAMEVPVISTAVGSIREVVLHNQTGMVVPEKDPEAIISAIEEIFQSHNLSNKLAKNGRALIVDRFDPQLAVDKVQHLFQLIED